MGEEADKKKRRGGERRGGITMGEWRQTEGREPGQKPSLVSKAQSGAVCDLRPPLRFPSQSSAIIQHGS